MARRNDAGLAFGGILGLLVLVAMCTAGGSDDDPVSPYSSSVYTPPPSAPAPAAEREPREWFYIHGPLNVRAAPNRDAAIVSTLRRGDMVQLGPKDAGGWARVYSGSPEGYVYRASEQVRTNPPATAQSLTPSGASTPRARSRRSSGSRVYHTGPRGGCYYYSSSGRKQYVDRSYCR